VWSAYYLSDPVIQQAYKLLTHCGFLEEPTAELERRECPTCLIEYPIVISLPLRTKPCRMHDERKPSTPSKAVSLQGHS